MSKPKQSTLFQSWGPKKNSQSKTQDKHLPNQKPQVINLCEEYQNDDVDDDVLLAMAMEQSLKDMEQHNQGVGNNQQCHNQETEPNTDTHTHMLSRPGTSRFQQNENGIQKNCGNVQQKSLWNQLGKAQKSKDTAILDVDQHDLGDENFDGEFDEPFDPNADTETTQLEDLPGFDNTAGRLWIYPTNYPVRDYQYNIVQKALYKNTMVTLPTGLGKTFIAAVVMYNFYRWYPEGKVIFMAPTKPLVAQQIEACYNIMGIPQKDTAEMTGTMQPDVRVHAWKSKRLFFLTPQVLTNDLSRGVCPAEVVKCLVVDEAHKALGNHAYCQVVRELIKYTREFRVLALSATPGSDIKAVQQVLSNLLISHIELRTEESADIKPYAHERKVEKIVVGLGEELITVRAKYMQIVSIIVNRLIRLRVLYNRDPKSFSKFLILKARDQFRQDPPQHLQRSQFGAIEGDFAMCMSLYHGYELLQQHGLRSLYQFLKSIVNGEKGQGRTRTELMRNDDFNDIMDTLRDKFEPANVSLNTSVSSQPSGSRRPLKPFTTGHPKLEKLQEVVLEHFCKFQNDNPSDAVATRIMIFSQYRDSVKEITDMLNRHKPLVRVMSFIGQSSAGKSTKGYTQKEQLKVMREFREGGYNTLVSTCVGEEGLDIGDVDLIICFDAHKSPIRLVQRMGRTGRKREGRIVMLVTEGKEESIYNQSVYSKKSIHKAILNGAKSLHFYPHNPRMVPKGLMPQAHKMHITVTEKFKGKKGKAGGTGTKKITSLMIGTAKKQQTGFLTDEELGYWSEHYKVSDNEVPVLPGVKLLSLPQKGTATVQESSSYRSTLSLSEWTPWQNSKQPTHKTGHSFRTQHLVELMQFCELQGILGEEEDSYGLEMRAYFNEEDIIKPGEMDNSGEGILKYCKNLDVDGNNGGKNGKGKAGKKKNMKRRSETLPEFSSGEEVNSDDELPCFKIGKETNKNPCVSESVKRNSSEGSNVKSMGNGAENRNCDNNVLSKKGKITKGIKCKRKSSEIGSSPIVGKKLSEVTPSSVKKKSKKMKKIMFQKNQSLIKPIADINDKDDFLDRLSQESRSNGVIVENEPSDNIEPVCVDIVSENEGDGVDGKQGEMNYSQLFQTVTPRKSEKGSSTHSDIAQKCSDKCSQSQNSNCAVRTPPSLEELMAVMSCLEKKDHLSPVNILDLVEEWQLEKKQLVENCKKNLSFDNLPSSNKRPKISVASEPVKFNATQGNMTKSSKSEIPSALAITDHKSENTEVASKANIHEIIKSLDVVDSDEEWGDFSANFGDNHGEYNTENQNGNLSEKDMKVNTPAQKKTSSNKSLCQGAEIADTSKKEQKNSDYGMSTSICEADTGPTMETDLIENVKSEQMIDNVKDVSHDHIDISGLMSPGFNKVSVSGGSRTSTPLAEVQRNSLRQKASKVPSLVLPCVYEEMNLNSPIVEKAKTRDKPVSSLAHGSFFEDEHDDFLMAAAATPTSVKSNRDITLLSESHNISSATPKISAAPLNESQLTFTQAMKFVHSLDSTLKVTPTQNTCSATPVVTSALGEKTNSGNETNQSLLRNDSEIQRDVRKSKTDFCKDLPEGGVSEVRVNDDSDSQVQEPQFDLGFDLDGLDDSDFDDDEDVIPPSPPSTQPFSSQHSVRCTSSQRKSVIPKHRENTPELQTTNEGHADFKMPGTKPVESKQTLSNFKKSNYEENSETVHTVAETQFDDGDGEGKSSPSLFHSRSSRNPTITMPKILTNKNSISSSPSMEKDEKGLGNESALIDKQTMFENKCNSKQTKNGVCAIVMNNSNIWTPSNVGSAGKHTCVGIESEQPASSSSELLGRDVSMNVQNQNKKCDATKSKLSLKRKSTSPLQNTNKVKISDEFVNRTHVKTEQVTAMQSFAKSSHHEEHIVQKESDVSADLFGNHDYSINSFVSADVLSASHIIESVPSKESTNKEESGIKIEEGSIQIASGASSSESDDDVVMRKKKKTQVIESPDSPLPKDEPQVNSGFSPGFKTPLKPVGKKAVRNKKPILVSSDEDDSTPVKRSLKTKLVRQLQDISHDSEDEDFQETSNIHGKINMKSIEKLNKRNRHHSVNSNKKAKKKALRRQARGFIEDEAELSDDEINDYSSDEIEDNLDGLEESFIHDETQCSQQGQDIHAIYMQSVRSPHRSLGGGKYKLNYNYRRDMNVFSQMPPAEEEESQYMEDSFCVGSDYEESVITEHADSLLDGEESFIIQSHHSRRSKMKAAEKQTTKPKQTTGRRRRVMQIADSSSEEEGNDNETKNKENKSETQMEGNAAFKKPNTDLPFRSYTGTSASNTINTQMIGDDLMQRCQSRIAGSGKTETKNIQKIGQGSDLKLGQGQRADDKMEVTFSLGFEDIDDDDLFTCADEVDHGDNQICDVSRDKQNNTSSHHSSINDKTNDKIHVQNAQQHRKTSLSSKLASKLSRSSTTFAKQHTAQENNHSGYLLNGSSNKFNQINSHGNSLTRQSSAIDNFSDKNSSTFENISPAEKAKLERLQRQRQKQEEFRRKMQQTTPVVQQSVNANQTDDLNDSLSFPPEDPTNMADQVSASLKSVSRPMCISNSISSIQASANLNKMKQKQVVLVDSREINGAQDIVSDLRLRHNLNAVVRQLTGCDYIVSNRMGVERKTWSDFSNSSNKNKLVERIRQLIDLFDRPVVILEKDRVKPGEEKHSRTSFRTKYADTMLCYLGQAGVKILYSESQAHTAELLSQLCALEARKSMAIVAPYDLVPTGEHLMKIYQSMPNISYVTALNLCQGFKTWTEFINSPAKVLEMRGKISQKKAHALYLYVRHTFDPQMLAGRYK